MTTLLRGLLPRQAFDALRSVRVRVDSRRLAGDAVWCPVCERGFRSFVPFHGREAAACPGCRSLERHRLMWLFFQRGTDLLTAQTKVLHVAPERHLQDRLRSMPTIDYLSGDLLGRDAKVKIDVTAIDLPDESFDVVLCSHVLEHVTDDSAAMRELLRVTRPGGWAVLDAPVDENRAQTYEDWAVTDPRGREAHFGQRDHVRVYGRNYPDLLRAAGWEVTVDPLVVSRRERTRMGLRPGVDRIFLCRRPVA